MEEVGIIMMLQYGLHRVVHALGVALFGGIAYLLLWIVYRLSFHPLAKYPGPFLAKVSDWYDVYHAYRGDKHINFYLLHERYGVFVRYGPNKLSINHPSALKKIYGHKANIRKSDFYLAFPAAPGVFSTHTAIDRHAHARKRRVMSHAFSDAALKGLENLVLVHIRSFIYRLGGRDSNASLCNPRGSPDPARKEWTEPRNLSAWSSYLAFDVMGDLCFGKSFGMLGDKPENREAVFLLAQAARRHNITGPMPFLHRSGLDKYLFRSIFLNRQKYLAFSRKQVMERTKSDMLASNRKDMFYHLLRSRDPETGEGFSAGELWGESNTLIIAGSDTTSTTLTATLFYLLHDRSVLSCLYSELRQVFDDADKVRSGPVLNGCHYLRACIDEALRMSPPVGAVLPRTVLPGGLELLERHIPAGIDVGCPIYALQHNNEYVSNSFVYNPSRWIAGEAQVTGDSLERLHSVFNPFSVGPRACIGKPMAYLELMLTLARLVLTFDMKLPEGELRHIGEGGPQRVPGRRRVGEFQMVDNFVSEKEGLFALFKRRESDRLF